MSFKKVVDGVEMLALVAIVVFVVLLFRSGSPVEVASDDPVLQRGAQIFASRCAGCHGPEGQGYAGRPALNEGKVVAAFPDIEAQIAVVSNGRNSMPSFGGRLDEAEIEAVVRFTREVL